MKKYLSEKNALTVMACLFCFVMMIIAITKDKHGGKQRPLH
jgi:hypothetical protein